MELPCRRGVFELLASHDMTRPIILGTPVHPILQLSKIKSRTGPKTYFSLSPQYMKQRFNIHANLKQGFKCYVDADWVGNWLKSNPNSPAGILSCSGFLIKYADCPILWGSKMQSLVALSTTEAEIIALSTALREVIHLQNLLQELRANTLPITFTKAQIHCRTFEDNAACIKVVTSEAKIRPRTKHLAVCLFHFRDHIEKGHISIEHVPSRNQLADIFTKPLPSDQFRRLHDQIMGWNNAPIAEYEGV